MQRSLKLLSLHTRNRAHERQATWSLECYIAVNEKSSEDNLLYGRLIFLGKTRVVWNKFCSRQAFMVRLITGDILSHFENQLIWKELLKDKIFYKKRNSKPGGSFILRGMFWRHLITSVKVITFNFDNYPLLICFSYHFTFLWEIIFVFWNFGDWVHEYTNRVIYHVLSPLFMSRLLNPFQNDFW